MAKIVTCCFLVAATMTAIAAVDGQLAAEPAHTSNFVLAQVDRQPAARHDTALILNPKIVKAGETITAEVHVVNVLNYRIEVKPAVRRDDISVQTIIGNPPTDGVNPISGLFVHEIETADLDLPGTGGFFADPSRGYFNVTLSVLPAGGGSHVAIQTERMFISRDVAALPPDRFSPGEVTPGPTGGSIEVSVSDGLEPRTQIEIVRLGRYLPGGAVVIDHPADRPVAVPRKGGEYQIGPGSQFTDEGVAAIVDPAEATSIVPQRLREDLASTTQRGGRFSVTSPFNIGHFELRAVGRGGALISRTPVTFKAPQLSGVIGFVPEQDTPYTFDSMPAVSLRLPDTLNEATRSSLFVSVSRIGRGGVLSAPGPIAIVPLDLLQPGETPDIQLLPITDLVAAGTYEVRLWQGTGGESYLIDRRVFEVGGTPPPWAPPLKPVGADIELEDLVVSSDSKAAIWRDPLRVSVTGRSGIPIGSSNDEEVIASLFHLGHYTYGCAWRQGFYGPSAPVRNGQAILPAPTQTGQYEIRVFRTLAFNGDARQRLPVVPPSGQFTLPELQLIGVGSFDAVAPAAPGAISLSATALGPDDPLQIAVELPEQGSNPHSYQLELWMSGDRLPGGVLRAPLIRDTEFLSVSGSPMFRISGGGDDFPTIALNSLKTELTLDPLILPGDYEIRLFDRTTGLHVDRALFSIRDPGQPALPAEALYRRSAITDWPEKNDPQRGVEAWIMPKDACEDPVFPEPPDLRLVELYSSDPEKADDNEYVPVTSVQPGHPIFVEAEFVQSPPDEIYRVKVDGKRLIRIYRTENPRLYRSRLVALIPGGAGQ